MTELTEPLDFRGFRNFFDWLGRNHRRVTGARIFIYKKAHADRGIGYEDAVRAALCWGWIDGVARAHDEIRYTHRFSPRRPGSQWSASNIRRMMVLMDGGEMTEAGLQTFDRGLIDRIEAIEIQERARREGPTELPDFARDLLDADVDATARWGALPLSHRRNYVRWILEAKREPTRLRRVDKMIRMLVEGRSQSEL